MKRLALLLATLALGCGTATDAAHEAAQEGGRDAAPALVLANGLRVHLLPRREEKRVVVLLGVRAGFFAEPAGVPHVAHVTEHAAVFDLKPGSPEAQAVARWYSAGQANAETLADFMYFDLHVSPEEAPLAVKVQAARLAAPEFTPATVAREIPRTLQEVEVLEKSPYGGLGKFALTAFTQAAFHGQTAAPIKARTPRITVEDVRAFHSRTFRPDRAVLAVIGDFDPATTRPLIEQSFGSIKRPAGPPALRPALKPGRHTVTWDATTQHLILAWPTPAPAEADHPALSLAALALNQRLFTDPQLTSLFSMPQVSNEAEGLFFINVQLKPGADPAAARAKLLAHVEQLARPGGLGDVPANQARFQLRGTLKTPSLEGLTLPPQVTKTMALANMELQRLLREAVWGDVAAYSRRLDGVTADQVRSAVARHLTDKTLTEAHIRPE
jgi:zinc protease